MKYKQTLKTYNKSTIHTDKRSENIYGKLTNDFGLEEFISSVTCHLSLVTRF